jgi:hypothetical protein
MMPESSLGVTSCGALFYRFLEGARKLLAFSPVFFFFFFDIWEKLLIR